MDERSARLSGLGEGLRVVLTDGRPSRAVPLLRRPFVASVLASQVLVLSVRRAYAGPREAGWTGPDPVAILERDGSSTSQRRRLAAALFASIVSVTADFPRIPVRDQDVVLVLLTGLVRAAHLTDGELVELIRTGEWRLVRLARKPRRGLGPGILSVRRFVRHAGLAQSAQDDPGPRTVIGRYLAAMMRFDPAGAEPFGRGADGDGEFAVVDSAFASIVRRQFSSAPHPSELAGLAARATGRCRSPLISPAEVTALVRAEFGADDDGPDLGPQDRCYAKIGTVIELAEQLGLLLSEIRDLVGAAEQAAFAAGFRPVLAGA